MKTDLKTDSKTDSKTDPKQAGIKPAMKKTASFLLKGFHILLKKTIDILTDINATTELYRLAHLDFSPRDDDIVIVTYPRSGTTWMQMILYQLTTDGNMDIPHISVVTPWIERSFCMGLKTPDDFESLPSPRVFKSHMHYSWTPKWPCRFIYIVRNGKDVAVSYYHLYKTHLNFKGTFSEFFDLFIRGKLLYDSWFEHVAGWWKHKDAPNILFLKYEDLKRDLEGCVREIADFCEIEIQPERFPEILERCSFSYMKTHESVFDPTMEKMLEKGYILNSFFRKGETGQGKQYLTPEQEKVFEKNIQKYMV